MTLHEISSFLTTSPSPLPPSPLSLQCSGPVSSLRVAYRAPPCAFASLAGSRNHQSHRQQRRPSPATGAVVAAADAATLANLKLGEVALKTAATNLQLDAAAALTLQRPLLPHRPPPSNGRPDLRTVARVDASTACSTPRGTTVGGHAWLSRTLANSRKYTFLLRRRRRRRSSSSSLLRRNSQAFSSDNRIESRFTAVGTAVAIELQSVSAVALM